MTQQAPTKIIVDPTLVERADMHCPTYMPRTVFLNVLIQEGLDKRSTLEKQPGRAAYISTSLEVDKKEEERARAELVNRPPSPPAKSAGDPFTKKAISLELIPDDLLDDSDLLLDFWKVKKGTRSERAWNGLVSKLRGMNAADRTKALTAAYEGGWATVYEPKPDTPQQGKWQPPETAHPASKVFRADDLDWPEPTHAVLEGLAG